MKYSKQSELIRNAMSGNKDHPTADMIYTLLKPENPNLSLATVYRNLNKLAEKGEILKLTIPNASDRFDSTKEEHFHMICIKCGSVIDCPFNLFETHEEIMAFEEIVFKTTAFAVNSIQTLIYGRCKLCNCD